jgi:hypothetical protein
MADIVTTRVFTDGEKNITAQKLNDIVGSSVIQPAFVSAKPSTSSVASTDNLLILTTGGTYAKAPFQTVIDSVSAAISSDTEIWAVRLRSFNAIGNPTFEVTQKNVGSAISSPGGAYSQLAIEDRWWIERSAGAMGFTNIGNAINRTRLPGTNFPISSRWLQINLGTQQTTLAASDFMVIKQLVEGPSFRELSTDVHSISLLVYCQAALKFTVFLRDANNAYSLVKLCNYTTPNTFQLIQLPNLPVWAPSGTFPITPGANAYTLGICLVAGSAQIAPAADTWQAGNFLGAPGMDNYAAKPVNTFFYCSYICHEPGAVCSTPIDCPFMDNYDACLRYYCKSHNYAVLPGTSGGSWMESYVWNPGTARGHCPFPKRMAKTPTCTFYDASFNGINLVYCPNSGLQYAGTAGTVGESGFSEVANTNANFPTTAGTFVTFHYTADTGW